MKNEKEIAYEIRNELKRELVEKYIEYDFACMQKPLDKQDKINIELRNLEDKISLLEKRYRL